MLGATATPCERAGALLARRAADDDVVAAAYDGSGLLLDTPALAALHLGLRALHDAVERDRVVVRRVPAGHPIAEFPFEPGHFEATKVAPDPSRGARPLNLRMVYRTDCETGGAASEGIGRAL